MTRIARIAALLLLPVLLVAASKVPSANDGRKDGYVSYGGPAMYPFQLYGVAVDWDRDCFKGKAAACRQLAEALEIGLGDLDAVPRAAMGYYKMACEKGHGPSCAKASQMLSSGSTGFTNAALAGQLAARGCDQLKDQASCGFKAAALAGSATTTEQRQQANSALDQSCAAGGDEACRVRAVGLMASKQAGDWPSAVRLFEQGCSAKRAWGCLGLSEAFSVGRGTTKDMGRAASYARTGCTEAQGDRLRVCALHGAYLSAGDAASVDKGEQFLSAACKRGDADACNHLGDLGYQKRAGSRVTPLEAVYYYRRACDLGLAQGCGSLAGSYVTGWTVKQDVGVGYLLMKKGCTMGGQSQCRALESLKTRYPSVPSAWFPVDPSLSVHEQLKQANALVDAGRKTEGVKTVIRLMEEGHENADWLLGGWLYYGLPGVFDTPRKDDALILFENAAKVGHVDAAVWLGMAYWYGDGVPLDRPKGENFMAIAATMGDAKADAILRSMKLQPVREANERRAQEMAEAAKRRQQDWSSSWTSHSAWVGSTSYTPAYSGPSVSSIIDNSNWNQRINYLSGSTTACPRTNSYC